MPSTPSQLKPGEVAAYGCRAEDGIGILLELLVWDGLIHGDLLDG